MNLYNTLNRKVEAITPQKSSHTTVYTCGPTVYDHPHIGNWFTFIRYDILIRALKAAGLKPKWVMNITDVGHLVSDADEGEDKLEKGARREGKTAWEVADFYTKNFLEGVKKLNFMAPDKLPKATDHIEDQIHLIKELEKKGFTYTINDGVYFDTSKFSDYGKLANLDIEHLKAGARVEANPEKHNPTDFALWKFSPTSQKRDMEWDSPWGKGFPGWHIECSAMSMKYLGETIDIHGGGIDHIPVHHTNEVAQSEAASGKQFSRYWFHTNHILINDQKIAKSAGNGITLEDIEQKGFSPMAVRMLVLESHYRTQSTFSWETLEAAQNRLRALQAIADLRWQKIEGEAVDSFITMVSETLPTQILNSLNDDLDTPRVLAAISTAEGYITAGYTSAAKTTLEDFLRLIDDTLGFQLLDSKDISEQQKDLINLREKAREKQDWAKSDEIRLELEKQGLSINDTDRGPIWSRL